MGESARAVELEGRVTVRRPAFPGALADDRYVSVPRRPGTQGYVVELSTTRCAPTGATPPDCARRARACGARRFGRRAARRRPRSPARSEQGRLGDRGGDVEVLEMGPVVGEVQGLDHDPGCARGEHECSAAVHGSPREEHREPEVEAAHVGEQVLVVRRQPIDSEHVVVERVRPDEGIQPHEEAHGGQYPERPREAGDAGFGHRGSVTRAPLVQASHSPPWTQRVAAPDVLGVAHDRDSRIRPPPRIMAHDADLTIDLGHDAWKAVDSRHGCPDTVAVVAAAAAATMRAMRSAPWNTVRATATRPPPSLVNVASGSVRPRDGPASSRSTRWQAAATGLATPPGRAHSD